MAEIISRLKAGYMGRLLRLWLIHLFSCDRCPSCYGLGCKRYGWASVPNCPDCKGSGFICWECGGPMKVVCGKNYLSYSCHGCAEHDHALFH